ncbi:MAG TPA: hypothetical protein GXX36_13545 [Clostridiaceae bacterium]|nr:hypothetical protein [Clostridiaceae bacterium]
MKKKYRVILRIILWSVLPSLLTFLGKSHIDLSFIQKVVPVFSDITPTVFKDYFLLTGMLISLILVDMQFAISEFDRRTVTSQRHFLIQYIKNIFIESLEAKLGEENTGINIRIFVPKRGILKNIKKGIEILFGNKVKFKKVFVIKNMDCLSEPGVTNGLGFEVKPEIQGLVGLCYHRKAFVYEEDIKSPKENFKMNEFQRDKLANIRFWMCVPVVNKKNEVIAIISFDSKNKIKISKLEHDELSRAVRNFSQFFGEGLPDLLK